MVRAALVSLLLAVFLAEPALPLDFGQPFPLTNTRYGSGFAIPKLVWTGRDLYVFWATQTHIRMTRVTGERRAGMPVFATYATGGELDDSRPWLTGHYTTRKFDVVWTGSHFVLVTTKVFGTGHVPSWETIVAQAIGTSGEALGPPRNLASFAGIGSSRSLAAFNGQVVLVLYQQVAGGDLYAAVLAKDMTPISIGEVVARGVHDFDLIADGSSFAAVAATAGGTHLQQFGGNGRLLSSTNVGQHGFSVIAANPRGWLLTSGVTAMFVDRGGTAGPLLRIGTTSAPFGIPAAAWNGVEWVITYGTLRNAAYEFNVLTVDERATNVTSQIEPLAGRSIGVTDAFDDRTYIAWWPTNSFPPPAPLFGEVPVISSGAELTFKASEQRLLASISSSAATLVVWSEEANNEVTVHAGVRARNGDWSERVLGGGFFDMPAVAATDGQNFLVITPSRDTSIAYRLDATGALLSDPIEIPFPVDSAVSNGRLYGLVGSGNRAITLTSSGSLGKPMTFSGTPTTVPFRPAIASDGSEFFIAWTINADCNILPCSGGDGIAGAWFTGDLRRRDTKDLILDFQELGNFGAPSVVWNGTDYVVAWDSRGGVEASFVPRLAGTPSLPIVVEKNMALWPDRVRATSDGVLLLSGNAKLEFAVTRIDRNRTITRLESFDFRNGLLRGWPRLEVLSDGRLALLTSPIVEQAPQHGTAHVMMSIQNAPSAPGITHFSAVADKRDVHLSWTAASGSVNGYRIEYRIGDGSWNEIAQWFTAAQRSAIFRLPRIGTRAVFRMRAFSDGGAGAYSTEVAVNATRRRSVR